MKVRFQFVLAQILKNVVGTFRLQTGVRLAPGPGSLLPALGSPGVGLDCLPIAPGPRPQVGGASQCAALLRDALLCIVVRF